MTGPTVVLVGPLAAGKTTLGKLVAQRTGQPFIDVDDVSWNYGSEVGWTLERLLARDEEIGWVATERDWEPGRVRAVQGILRDHAGSIIGFGAAYTNFTVPEHAQAVRAALGQADEVVHVLPSPEPAESVAILRKRAIESRGGDWLIEGHDWIAEWVADRLPSEVATLTVYTADVSAEEVADQIVAHLGR